MYILFLRLVYTLLSVFLDCPFLIAPSVFSFIYCQAIIDNGQVINLRGLHRTQFKLTIPFMLRQNDIYLVLENEYYNWVVIVICSVKREIYMI